MLDAVDKYINAMPDPRMKLALGVLLRRVADNLSSQVFSPGAGLAIKAASSPLVKAGTAFRAVANGAPQVVAANTDMAALSGTVTNAKFNVFVFFIDRAGALTTLMGREGATVGAIQWPDFPEKKAAIGCVFINPTGTGDFVGGTTALDNATVVPNAVYVNFIGAVDPSIVVG